MTGGLTTLTGSSKCWRLSPRSSTAVWVQVTAILLRYLDR
jgi:hypothetical protein